MATSLSRIEYVQENKKKIKEQTEEDILRDYIQRREKEVKQLKKFEKEKRKI